MRHELSLKGHRFGLRPVEMADAGFIVALRTDPELGRYMHPTSPRVEDQEAWLAAYFERADDYYFIIDDLKTGEPVGTIGIYDIDERREAVWGRWIVQRGSLAAVESVMLIYRMGLETLGLTAVRSQTVAGNARVVSFHDSTGAPRHAVVPGHFVLDGTPHDSIEHRVDRAAWAAMAPRLELLAKRVAAS